VILSAYPEGFADWPETRRNAHFAAAAKAYDERKRSKLRFEQTPFGQFKLDEHAPYLVKGLLPRSGLAVVWGPPKCGKSFWAFDLLMHVGLGWEYRGHRVISGPIVYCALEGAEGFRKRIEAFRQAKLAEGDASPPFYLMTAPLGLVQDASAFLGDVRTQLVH
jgi:hypothetical protein